MISSFFWRGMAGMAWSSIFHSRKSSSPVLVRRTWIGSKFGIRMLRTLPKKRFSFFSGGQILGNLQNFSKLQQVLVLSRKFDDFSEIPITFHQVGAKNNEFDRTVAEFCELFSYKICKKQIDKFWIIFWALCGTKSMQNVYIYSVGNCCKNECPLAKIGLDTLENEPLKVWGPWHT